MNYYLSVSLSFSLGVFVGWKILSYRYYKMVMHLIAEQKLMTEEFNRQTMEMEKRGRK